MATGSYERVLEGARQLPVNERRRLLAELEADLQAESAHDAASRTVQAEAVLAQVDALANEITRQWQGGGTAVDAVREGRREL